MAVPIHFLWFKQHRSKNKYRKLGAEAMLTFKIDSQDCLLNGQVTEVVHIDIAQNSVQKVYMKFSNL